MAMNSKPILDQTDLLIISKMLEEAKTPYAELGKELLVSGGTIHVRHNKLKELGIITGSTLKVNFQALGYEICAFVGINLTKSAFYDHVLKTLKTIPEIVSAHYTTGQYSIFVKLMCKDSAQLREVLSKQIGLIEGIKSTETFLSLDEPINRMPQVISSEA